MAKVRCPCGRSHEIPASQLGQQLTCSACGRIFVAEAAAADPADALQAELAHATADELAGAFFEEEADADAPAEPAGRPEAPRTPRLGELAVERALVSQEHIDLCVEVQQALHVRGVTDKRIGEILVEKGLLKPEQVEMLLSQQAGEIREEAPPAADIVPHPPEPPKPEPPAPKRRASAVGTHVRRLALAVVAAAVVVLAIKLWPSSRGQRALTAYLDSCREGQVQPKGHLAVTHPGFVVRDYRIEGCLEPSDYDLAPELQVFNTSRDQGTWSDLLEAIEMPIGKRKAIELVLPCLPEALSPRKAGTLSITLQPIACRLFLKPRNGRFFSEARYHVTMARARSPHWDSGWRFAGYEPAPK